MATRKVNTTQVKFPQKGVTGGGQTYPVIKRMPKGWSEVTGAQTAPNGYVWVSNGKPMFKKGADGKYRTNKGEDGQLERQHAIIKRSTYERWKQRQEQGASASGGKG